jgi:tetratricopeptide (TPR) repeat protein
MKWRLVPLALCLIIQGMSLSSCTSSKKGLKSENPPEIRPERILLERALEYERKAEFQKALQAYEATLALVAAKKEEMEASLRSDAERHYRLGLKLQEQGKHAQARHEFLVALRSWPEFPEAIDQLQATRNSRYVVHEVKEGEYLTAIAQRYYNDESKYKVIALYNNLEDAAKLKPGLELKIPEIEGTAFSSAKRMVGTKSSPEKQVPKKMPDKNDKEPTGKVADKAVRKARPRGQSTVSGGEKSNPLVSDEQTLALAEEMGYDPVVIYRELGISLLEEGRYLAALQEFQKVMNTDSNNKEILKYMTRAHYRQGEALFQEAAYLEARRHFQEALKLDKQCSHCQNYLKRTEDAYKEAHYLKGIQHFEEQRLKEAIEEWQLVSELDSDYKQVQNYLLRAQKLIDKVQELTEEP